MFVVLSFAFAVQWLIFIHAWFAQTEHFFDLTGSLTYIVLVLAACYLSEAFDIRSLVIVGLVLIWAFRLGPFLFRIQKAGEDRRFRSIKVSFPTFFMTWTRQGAWVFVTVSAGLGAITSSNKSRLGWPFILASRCITGFRHRSHRRSAKDCISCGPSERWGVYYGLGLVAPNYFGEILLWAGIAVIMMPTLQGNQIFLLLSLIWVVVLLTAISGVRMLEGRGKNSGAMTQSILIT